MAGKLTYKELERRIRALEKEAKKREEVGEALRKSEERLKLIVNGLPVLIAYVDADQKYQFVNREYENWFGLSPADIVGKRVRDVVGDAGYEKVREKIEEVLSGQPVSYQDELPFEDGTSRHYQAHYVPQVTPEGWIPGYFIMVEDITDRRQAEEELQKLSRAVDESPVSVIITDREGSIEYVNPKFVQLTGYTSEEVIGQNPRILKSGEHPPEFYQALWETIAQGKEWQGEFYNKKKSGDYYWESASISPIKNERDVITHFVAVKEDITQRKQAERMVRNEKDRAQKYLDIAGAVILVLNADQTVSLVNRKGCAVLEYEEWEIIGRNWFDVFVPDKDRDQTRVVFEKLMGGDIELTEYYENPVLTKGGEERLVAWHNTLLRDEEGRITGTLSSGEDITERKRAEKALQKANDDLEERIKELNCLYGISKLLEKRESSLEEIIEGLLNLIPSSWQYSGVTCARVILEGQEFKTENFRETIWKQTSDIVVHAKRAGMLEVFYLEERPAGDEGPFLEEERNLLDAIAERLGRIIERVQAEEALRRAHDELEDRVRARTAELSRANQNLQREINERQQAETALRRSEAALRHLSSRLLTAQEEERKRIALELHDSIAQRLAAIKFSLESKLDQMGESPPPPGISVEEIISMVQIGIEETRRIMTNLRPSMLDELGIISTIHWHLREFERVYGAISLRKRIDIQEEEFPDPLKIVIYRILQEATSNIARHSEADLISLDLRRKGNAIEMCIQDNGVGFEVDEVLSKVSSEKGLGLMGMKERTEYSGGSFSIESRKGEGTIIRTTWQC
ncbi:MAG: PAS domain S-box protein [Desulfobacteraceae bacterium]